MAKGEVLLILVVLGFLWFTLINQLRVEWSVNAQYSYGWAVPILCGYLLWERLRARKKWIPDRQRADVPAQGDGASETPLVVMAQDAPFLPGAGPEPAFARAAGYGALAALALLWLPVRLIQEANPEWRLISWALALVTVGLTLLLCSAFRFQHLARDSSALSLAQFAFPIAFIFVAVPWPSVIEGPVIQVLTRFNAMVTTELVNLLGIPAICHGNVIEVGSGVVGIDDACSGIRSFQATLMLSLFFGEVYRLSVAGRFSLCLAGFAVALAFNLARTTLLTTVAARQGVDAISKWHDPAGVVILVSCFITLWGIGAGMGGRKAQSAKVEARRAAGNEPRATSEGRSAKGEEKGRG